LSIDPVSRRVALLDRVVPREPRLPDLAFDELVLVPSPDTTLPADFSHALGLASEADARRLVARVIEALELASTEDSERRRTSLATVVVVGGGETGVALAGELRALIDRLLPLYPRVSPREARVLLVEENATLLPRYVGLGAAAAKELERLGIALRLRTRAAAVASDHVMTDSEGESTRIDSRTVVYAGGAGLSPMLARLAAFGDVSPQTDTGLTALPGVRVFGGAPRVGLTGPSLARVRREAATLAASIGGATPPPAQALARTSGFLAFGEGAIARLYGTGPALRGSLARPFVAWDHGGPRQNSSARLWSAWRHLASGRRAPLPGIDAETLSLASKTTPLPPFFGP
jgi:hypothetical protein